MVAYILYECAKPKIGLDRDLHFIENYIALQRLRLASNTTLTLEMPKDIPQKEIEPMLLISYIENAFKHGLTTTQPCEIFISIQIDKNRLFMRVENQVLADNAVQKDTQSGIGLENTQQRLAHSYPEKHRLSIQNDGKKHIVELEIDL
jgi:LytS/YehU family sensor histidine kinase